MTDATIKRTVGKRTVETKDDSLELRNTERDRGDINYSGSYKQNHYSGRERLASVTAAAVGAIMALMRRDFAEHALR